MLGSKAWRCLKGQDNRMSALKTATRWAIYGGIGQLILYPFGMSDTGVWCGCICGAVAEHLWGDRICSRMG
jgi:hypothetical protein